MIHFFIIFKTLLMRESLMSAGPRKGGARLRQIGSIGVRPALLWVAGWKNSEMLRREHRGLRLSGMRLPWLIRTTNC